MLLHKSVLCLPSQVKGKVYTCIAFTLHVTLHVHSAISSIQALILNCCIEQRENHLNQESDVYNLYNPSYNRIKELMYTI